MPGRFCFFFCGDKPVNTMRKLRSELINRRNHPHIQPIRDLQIRKERERTNNFFVDGLRFVHRAFLNGAHIERLVVSPNLVDSSGRNLQLIERLQRKGVPVSYVTDDVYKSICTAEDPQGFGAVVRQRIYKLRKVAPGRGTCWLAASSIRSPGNLGTIMRTAEAVSAAGIIMIGDSVDPFHPATVRASMGSIFSLNLIRTTMPEFSRWVEDSNCFVVGSSPSANLDYRLVAYPQRTILLIGDERKGLSSEQLQACSVVVSIPMSGSLDSLNVSIATSVILFEVRNQLQPPCLPTALQPLTN
jgi:RNA methyltransferase, TrmH family